MKLGLADFEGLWRLDRAIDDRRAGQMAHLAGTARLATRDGGLDYSESGVLHLPGVPPMQATRRYRWEADGEEIRVLFDDGRPFHSIIPAMQVAEATHWCNPDRYCVTYDFTRWPCWTSRWTVSGPRKAYVMESRYFRA
ncbi:DUF6314 family protein [Tropicimonas sp.]|uniref:DUF6314 family protein n=1 Tax=Tropicimonas sp. TaxID=2067044 RepID=UPI003A8C8864